MMKKWRIVISKPAKADLVETRDYIVDVLREPSVARNLIKRIREQIGKLAVNPAGYAVYDYEPWRSRGARRVNVGNFAVFFIPDETTHTVTIIRMMYGKRNFND